MPSNLFKSYWSDTSSISNAKRASHVAVGSSIFIILMTTIFVVMPYTGNEQLGISESAVIDVTITLCIAIGIYRQSRTAAWFGLILYIFQRFSMFATTGQISNPIVLIGITLSYVSGIRGTFAYHRLRRSRINVRNFFLLNIYGGVLSVAVFALGYALLMVLATKTPQIFGDINSIEENITMILIYIFIASTITFFLTHSRKVPFAKHLRIVTYELSEKEVTETENQHSDETALLSLPEEQI